MSILDYLVGQLAPHDCLACGAEGELLCLACLQVLAPVPPQLFLDGPLARVQAVTPYSGAAKDLVWKLKSNGAQSAARLMAALMVDCLQLLPGYLIVPVPTATSRVRQRGYDQAKLLARQLARQSHLPYFDCLARTGQAHQVGANRAQRLVQLQTAFRLRRSRLVHGANIILVDDVVTTGTTLRSAAAVLRLAGARQVQAVTFAQA